MPRGDGTGPRGRGPKTGKGKGACGGGGQADNTIDRDQTFGRRLLSGIGRMFGYGQGTGGAGQGRRGGQHGNR